MSVYCRKKGNEDEPKMFVKVREREREGREGGGERDTSDPMII